MSKRVQIWFARVIGGSLLASTMLSGCGDDDDRGIFVGESGAGGDHAGEAGNAGTPDASGGRSGSGGSANGGTSQLPPEAGGGGEPAAGGTGTGGAAEPVGGSGAGGEGGGFLSGAGGADAGNGGESGSNASGGSSGATGGVAGNVSTGGSSGSSGGTPPTGGSAGSDAGAGGESGSGSAGTGSSCPSAICESPFLADNCGKDCGPITSPECLACEEPNYCLDNALCSGVLGDAEGGPAAGVPRSNLCNEVLDCLRDTGCGAQTDPLFACYCGDTESEACLEEGGGTGPCRLELQRGVESTDYAVIYERVANVQYGGSTALLRALCDVEAMCPLADCFTLPPVEPGEAAN